MNQNSGIMCHTCDIVKFRVNFIIQKYLFIDSELKMLVNVFKIESIKYGTTFVYILGGLYWGQNFIS